MYTNNKYDYETKRWGLSASALFDYKKGEIDMRKEDKKELQLYGYFAWMVVSLFIATQFVHRLIFKMVDGSFLEPVPVANLSVLIFLIAANFVYSHILNVFNTASEIQEKKKEFENRRKQLEERRLTRRENFDERKKQLKERMERKWS